MDDKQLQGAIDALPHPKVTKDSITQRVKAMNFTRIGEKVTVCCITMVNGFEVIAHSACVDPRNFDEAIGRELAYANAFEQLWALEGYLLAERQRVPASVCPACPIEVRNLFAVTHNMVNRWDSWRLHGESICKVAEKMQSVREAVASVQPLVDAHFAHAQPGTQAR